jgi:hypothetical protein
MGMTNGKLALSCPNPSRRRCLAVPELRRKRTPAGSERRFPVPSHRFPVPADFFPCSAQAFPCYSGTGKMPSIHLFQNKKVSNKTPQNGPKNKFSLLFSLLSPINRENPLSEPPVAPRFFAR